MPRCTLTIAETIATILLNDPEKRNALSLEMFDDLDRAIVAAAGDDAVRVVILTGSGRVFCAGFDLAAAHDDPSLMTQFIHRLSTVNRALRAMPVPVIASVRGAAIAGGCALLSACDFVVAESSAKLGYPVHAIGVSPAVTLPTLAAAIGPGAARALVLAGALIDGNEAHRLGLITHLVQPAQDEPPVLERETLELARNLAAKPPHALRVTKAWLNELDRTDDVSRFDRFAEASAAIAQSDEAVSMLRAVWSARSTKR